MFKTSIKLSAILVYVINWSVTTFTFKSKYRSSNILFYIFIMIFKECIQTLCWCEACLLFKNRTDLLIYFYLDNAILCFYVLFTWGLWHIVYTKNQLVAKHNSLKHTSVLVVSFSNCKQVNVYRTPHIIAICETFRVYSYFVFLLDVVCFLMFFI